MIRRVFGTCLAFLITVCCLSGVSVPSGYGTEPDRAAVGKNEDFLLPEELRKLQLQHVDLVLFDARNSKSYNACHIEGAVLPLPAEYYTAQDLYATRLISTPPDADAALAKAIQKYSKDARIVTYCNKGCGAGAVLMNKLMSLGFRDVKTLRDGIQTWEEKGYPVVKAAPAK